jgi:pantoate--beta-alanine ligase
MRQIRKIAELRQALAPLRAGGTVGFVPTMGALHAGHVALFRRARRDCTTLVASIFVNPTQFNDPKDLAAYPRPEHLDATLASEAGVDVLFLPEVGEVYPTGHATSVSVGGAALGFEGAHRPGHFDGVATVCLKLVSMVAPDCAYFGQKDVQQVAVIQQMVRDLNLALEIRVAPTVRDVDGLALSSRNVRLSVAERVRALAVPASLRAALDAHRQGADPAGAARQVLADLEVEYAETATFAGEPVFVVAVRVGATRLIDNVPLLRPEAAGLGL